MTALAPLRVSEAADSMQKASTPRPIGHTKKGLWNRGPKEMLPPYMQHVASHFIAELGESGAVERAVGIVKNWKDGSDGKGGKVHPDTQAAAQKAWGEWEAKKAKGDAKKGAQATGKVSERRVPSGGVSLADRVTLRTQAKARLRAIEEAFGLQAMMSLLEASTPSWSPELKRTASAGTEGERFEVHHEGQMVGTLASRKGYASPGTATRPTRWNAKAVNGKMCSDTEDSKSAALDGLRKHLEEAPARVAQHADGKWLVAEPETYGGQVKYGQFPSEGSARYAAGLPEKETAPERTSKVQALGEMICFDVSMLGSLGEELPSGFAPLAEVALAEAVETPAFRKGDRVNFQHSSAGRVQGHVTKVTSRHVHVSSRDPRVSPMRLTHQQAASRLSATKRVKESAPPASGGVLGSLLESRVQEAALTAKQRNALPKDDFVYPDKAPGSGSYPIDTRKRAIAALARAADPANSGDEADVQAKVYSRYPDLKPSKGK